MHVVERCISLVTLNVQSEEIQPIFRIQIEYKVLALTLCLEFKLNSKLFLVVSVCITFTLVLLGSQTILLCELHLQKIKPWAFILMKSCNFSEITNASYYKSGKIM